MYPLWTPTYEQTEEIAVLVEAKPLSKASWAEVQFLAYMMRVELNVWF